MPSSAGASIPPELFQQILKYVVVPVMDVDAAVCSGASVKRPISSCARVCRYWTRICRPQLLERIVLRSALDIRVFIDFLDAPPFGNLEPFAILVKKYWPCCRRESGAMGTFCLSSFASATHKAWIEPICHSHGSGWTLPS